MALPLISQPTKNVAIGVYENNGENDIFQIIGPDGAVQTHMNADGTIDPPTYPQTSVTVISSAQLKALNTTPVVLVPSPGPGLIIVPVSISFVFQYVAPTYSNTGSDGDLYVGYGLTAASVTTNFLLNFTYSGLVESASSQMQIVPFSNASIALNVSANQPLSLGILDTLTTGAGKLQVDLAYNVGLSTF